MFLEILRLITKNTDGIFGSIWIVIIKIDQSLTKIPFNNKENCQIPTIHLNIAGSV